MMALSGVRSSCDMLARNSDFMRLASSSSTFFCCSALLEALQLRHVARRAEHALQLPVAVVEGRRVVGHHGERAVPGARGELVVGDPALGEHAVDARLGPVRIGEVVLERRADQLVARAPGQRLRLLVDVGDDAARIGGHQGVDVRFDERARVEVLVAEPLIELRALLLDLLARGVVGADEQVADDGARARRAAP